MERWTLTVLREDIQKDFEWQLSIPINSSVKKKEDFNLTVQTPFNSN